MVDSGVVETAINKANQVYNKYGSIINDPLKYNCESLLLQTIISEDIKIEPYSFTGDLCGLLYIDEYEITLVYNSNQPRERRNFTLGHELGHYFLHKDKTSQFADRTKDLLDNTIAEFEIQANVFSSYLILPKAVLDEMLKNKFSFFRIAKVAQISKEALFWRLVNHLRENYAMNQQEALFVVEDFKNFSIARYKNLVHHGFSLIYSLNKHNFKNAIEDRKNGRNKVIFTKNFAGEITKVDLLWMEVR